MTANHLSLTQLHESYIQYYVYSRCKYSSIFFFFSCACSIYCIILKNDIFHWKTFLNVISLYIFCINPGVPSLFCLLCCINICIFIACIVFISFFYLHFYSSKKHISVFLFAFIPVVMLKDYSTFFLKLF